MFPTSLFNSKYLTWILYPSLCVWLLTPVWSQSLVALQPLRYPFSVALLSWAPLIRSKRPLLWTSLRDGLQWPYSFGHWQRSSKLRLIPVSVPTLVAWLNALRLLWFSSWVYFLESQSKLKTHGGSDSVLDPIAVRLCHHGIRPAPILKMAT